MQMSHEMSVGVKMESQPDVGDLMNYLESDDLETVKHFKNVVQEKLFTSSDQTLLGALMDRYVQTKTETILELMIGIHDTLAMHLFDRLNEHLKHGASIEVCAVIFSMIKKQPSWLHKIIGTSLFVTFLKSLKTEEDIVFIMHGILILCSLIPCVPAIIGSHHTEILEVFVRTASFLVTKAGSIPEVCALHLNVGVYIFFHRLYTMYPNKFLEHMRSCFGGNKKKDPVFQEVIKPLFNFVKFHPDLITDTVKTETSLDKWKVYQPHDVLVDSQKISLDQLDMVKEATYAVFDSQEDSYPCPNEEGISLCLLNSYFTHPDSKNGVHKQVNGCETQMYKNVDPDSQCNPSEICSLYTPPSSVTHSDSVHDVSSISYGIRRDSDARSSTQTLNDVHDRLVRSSTGTFSNTSHNSPSSKHGITKTKSFGSEDAFTHRSMFRSLINGSNNYQSTPVDRRPSTNTSAPASPRKNTSNETSKRPQSTEFFRYKRDMSKAFELDHISDTCSIQSAPSSPMVNNSNFVFNDDQSEEVSSNKDKSEKSYQAMDNVKNENNYLRKHLIQLQTNPVTFLKGVREILMDLFPSVLRNSDPEMQPDPSSMFSKNLKKRSPLNLLDDFIQFGSDIHSYQLSRVPLTSQLDTDWTYYGGSTPTDELKILQTQVQLLLIQLKYERYKCELHCLRNRRLFGNVQKLQKARDEVDMLRDQIVLTDGKYREMKMAVGFKCEENREIKEQSSHREQEYMSKICKLEERNNKLEYKLKKHKQKKEEANKRIGSLEQELQKVKYQLFDYQQKYNHERSKLTQLNFYHDVTSALEKELLVQYDKQEMLKIRLEKQQMSTENHIDLEQKLAAQRHELMLNQQEKEVLHVHSESLKLKLNELELANNRKDEMIIEHKNNTKKIHSKHKMEMDALEKRFESTRKMCKSLQSYITSLYVKIEQSRSCQNSTSQLQTGQYNTAPRCSERCRKVSYSGPGSPHTFHDQSHRHSFTTSENPFRSRKQSQSNRSTSSEVSVDSSKDDSGIGKNSETSENNK